MVVLCRSEMKVSDGTPEMGVLRLTETKLWHFTG